MSPNNIHTLMNHPTDARNQKRRELSDLLERFVWSDDGGLYQCPDEDEEQTTTNDGSNKEPPFQLCPHHNARPRNGRCPLCAAQTTRMLRRNSSGSGGGESSDESSDRLLDPKWAGALRSISDKFRRNSLGMLSTLSVEESVSCSRPLSKSFNGGQQVLSSEDRNPPQLSSQSHLSSQSLSQLRQMILVAQQ
jgi:hypothetical protein